VNVSEDRLGDAVHSGAMYLMGGVRPVRYF
jgi:hypothetical protein